MPTNILIIKPSAMGDVATALPVLSSLRGSFPNARISWLVRKEFAPLLEIASGLDEIILFDRKRLGKWWCNPKVFSELFRFLSNLHKAKYDLVVDLQGLFRTGFFSWVTGSKRRFGMKPSREMASFFYTDKVRPDADSMHVIDQYLRVAAKAGGSKKIVKPKLFVPDEIKQQISDLLWQNGISGNNYAVFIPAAAHEFKCWPIEKFAECASKLVSEFSLKIVLAGTAGEKAYIDHLASSDGKIINLAGQTNIKELVALLKGSKFVLSNDTGPGQVASVLGVPMVMVIGNTNPKRIGTYRRSECIAAVDPTLRGSAIENPGNKYAIENVSVDMVYKKILSIFESGRIPGQHKET